MSCSSVLALLLAGTARVRLATESQAPQAPQAPHPEVGPRVLLNNTADANTSIPLIGLGMPCGSSYQCSQDSYTGTGTFLAIGGRRTDSADSYTGERVHGFCCFFWNVVASASSFDLLAHTTVLTDPPPSVCPRPQVPSQGSVSRCGSG